MERYYYDIISQISLKNNTWDILFFNKGKLKLSGAMHSSFFHMVEEIRSLQVYPYDQDIEQFMSLFNKESMNRLKHSRYKRRQNRARYRLLGQNREYRWVECTMEYAGGEEEYFLVYVRDLQAERTMEEANREQIIEERKRKIGFPGMDEFFEKSEQLIKLRPFGNFYMIVADLDHFELFEQIYGKENSEKNLMLIAEDVANIRDSKPCVVGYFGGDVFAVFIDIGDHTIRNIYQQLEHDLQDLYREGKGVSQSVGIYQVTNFAESVQEMYDKALFAVSQIRGDMGRQICVYDPEQDLYQMNKPQRIQEILDGIENHEFVGYFQPVCDTLDGQIVSAEFLARWVHGGRVIEPEEFVPLLEETGHILLLDRYIWEALFKHLREAKDAGLRMVHCSLNVSRLDIMYLDVVEEFQHLVDKYRIDPTTIGLEITESAYVENQEIVISTAKRLKELGFRLCLDNFGTGYSSLSSIGALPVDTIKIDKSFIRHIREPKTMKLVRSLLDISKLMGLETVMEGVENDEEFTRLLSLKCRYIQGFFYYQPMSWEEYRKLLVNLKK